MLFWAVSVPPWPRSITWYNSQGKIDDQLPNSRYKCLADGLGGYTLEVRPTEAEDQGEWKVVAASDEGAISISTCDIKMISKSIPSLATVELLLTFHYSSQTFQETQVPGHPQSGTDRRRFGVIWVQSGRLSHPFAALVQRWPRTETWRCLSIDWNQLFRCVISLRVL